MTFFHSFRQSQLAPLYEARDKAAEAHDRAKRILDMQAVRETRERLHAATHAALAAELRLAKRGRP